MNIIEKRRRKAWAHATMVIMNKVIREASTGTIFIYGETLYGKDYFLTPDDALDAVLDTMGVLRKLWERDGVRPSKRLFAEVCPDRAIGAVVMKMWREPFRFVPELIRRWNARVAATASIDKEVMEGVSDEERRDVAARLWKHIGKPLFTGQDVEDIIGVQRSDFDLILADASYRRLADLIEPEPERTCVRTLIKSGPVYDVWHFDCCDREYAENKTDAGATELPLNVCPFCGTSVMGEGRDAVHG